VFTSLEQFVTGYSFLSAPYADSIVLDPATLARGLQQLRSATTPTKPSKTPQYDYINFLVKRLQIKTDRLLYLRRESLRLYGRILQAVLQSLMIGRIRFKASPPDDYAELAADAYTKLYMRHIHPLVQTAIQDFFVCGLGGIAITPLGIYPLRPENTSAFPNFFQPRMTFRIFAMDWEDAKKVFNHPILKNEPPPIGYLPDLDTNPPGQFEPTRSLYHIPTCILTEIAYPNKFEYYYGNTKLGEVVRRGGWGHYLLVGDPRTLDMPTTPTFEPLAPAQREKIVNDPIWISERTVSYNELPIGLFELLVNDPYRGYNLLEAHEKLIEAILLRTTRASVCAVRADLLNLTDPNTQHFLDYYKPIATMGGEQPAAAIQFIDAVSLTELQAGLRELENQIVAITGITPYMMGLSGVSDVASEIVMMQSQANARINHIHSIITTWLGTVIDKSTQFLASIPPEYQTPLNAYNPSTKERVVIGGPETTTLPRIGYDQLFGRYIIESTLVGELTNINRRNELMQALQLTTQILPILAQMGTIYDIKQITDHILQTFNIDPTRITIQLQQQQQQEQPLPPEAAQQAAQQQPTPEQATAQQPPTEPGQLPAPETPEELQEMLAQAIAGGAP
jgi:hypothetical protein